MNREEILRLADFLECNDASLERQSEAAAELRRLHEAHDWQYKMAGERLRRIEKLEAQRDALLEALKAMLHMVERHAPAGLAPTQDSPVAKARAAIKAAEEEK